MDPPNGAQCLASERPTSSSGRAIAGSMPLLHLTRYMSIGQFLGMSWLPVTRSAPELVRHLAPTQQAPPGH